MEIKRDGEGIVTVDGVRIAKLNGSQSILSMPKTTCDGFADYTFDTDWVYVDGVKSHKQYRRVRSPEGYVTVEVWGPSMLDLSRLESRYRFVEQKEIEFYATRWHPAVKAIRDAGGEAHAIYTYPDSITRWCLYDVDEHGISFRYLDEAPANPINLELGKAYERVSRISEGRCHRVSKFKEALLVALHDKIDAWSGAKYGWLGDDYKNQGKQVDIVVNDRHYFFHAVPGRMGGFKWELLSWPDGKLTTLIV